MANNSAPISDEQYRKQQQFIAMLMSTPEGRAQLKLLQPLIAAKEARQREVAAYEQQQQAQKDANRQSNNALAGQIGGTVGGLAGIYAANNLATSGSLLGGSSAGVGSTVGGTTAGTTGTALGTGASTSAGTTAATTGAAPAAASSISTGSAATGVESSGAGALAGESTLGALGTGLGAGAVAAYYGPSYWKYANNLREGKTTQDSAIKTAALTNPITAWAVPIADKFGISFGSNGKGKDQLRRDQVRNNLADNGIIKGGNDYNLGFSDGSSFDIGKDGGARLTNAAGQKRQYSDVDFSDPRAGQVVGALNPLVNIITGGDKKLSNDFAGLYTNAVLNGASDDNTINARIRELYAKHGINNAADANKVLGQLAADKKLDSSLVPVFANGLNTVFTGSNTPYSQPQNQLKAPAPIAPGQTPASVGAATKYQPLQPGATPQQYSNAASGLFALNQPSQQQPQQGQGMFALRPPPNATPQEYWRWQRSVGLV